MWDQGKGHTSLGVCSRPAMQAIGIEKSLMVPMNSAWPHSGFWFFSDLDTVQWQVTQTQGGQLTHGVACSRSCWPRCRGIMAVSPNLSEPQFPCLYNGQIIPTGLSLGFSEIKLNTG